MNGYDRYLKQAESSANQGDRLQLRSSVAKSQQRKTQARFPIDKNQQKVSNKDYLQALGNSRKEQRAKTRKKFPVFATLFCLVGFSVTYWGYENFETLEKSLLKWSSKIEFSFFTTSSANEQSAEKAAKVNNKEKETRDSLNQTENVKTLDSASEGSTDAVDFNFIKDFQERKKQLDLREEELKKLEAEINLQKTSIDKKLEDVENIRKQITQQLDDRVKADEQKIDTLVQVYSQMKAPQAAKVFETLDEDLAVEILTKMKKKSAADILNLLKPDRAQSLSEKYAGYKRKPSSSSNNLPSVANENVSESGGDTKNKAKVENNNDLESAKNVKP
ncbi:MAG: hypothetical protein L6Q37_09180 [Bdellovibrionaceae bacterium]|nr:hypothetical protein [Pseudobdellovibrionaceae bacterium]